MFSGKFPTAKVPALLLSHEKTYGRPSPAPFVPRDPTRCRAREKAKAPESPSYTTQQRDHRWNRVYIHEIFTRPGLIIPTLTKLIVGNISRPTREMLLTAVSHYWFGRCEFQHYFGGGKTRRFRGKIYWNFRKLLRGKHDWSIDPDPYSLKWSRINSPGRSASNLAEINVIRRLIVANRKKENMSGSLRSSVSKWN